MNTPTLQRLADEGLRYNRFHTTALCSATRGAAHGAQSPLRPHRHHHGTGHRFSRLRRPAAQDSACVAETLKQNGYSTAAFGKWHNTPDYEINAAGPFDRWPTGLGFEYWWGFQGGEANQWNPPLFENTTPIEKPHDDPNWHFSEAMAEKCISWIGQQKASAPNKPFFIYWAPGAACAASRREGMG